MASRAFRAGCPHRPYSRHAIPHKRPGYCPCAWTDYMISRQITGIAAELLGDTVLPQLDALFPLDRRGRP